MPARTIADVFLLSRLDKAPESLSIDELNKLELMLKDDISVSHRLLREGNDIMSSRKKDKFLKLSGLFRVVASDFEMHEEMKFKARQQVAFKDKYSQLLSSAGEDMARYRKVCALLEAKKSKQCQTLRV